MMSVFRIVFIVGATTALLCFNEWRLVGSAFVSSLNMSLALVHRMPRWFQSASHSTLCALLFDGIVGLSFVSFLFSVALICLLHIFDATAVIGIVAVSSLSLIYAISLCCRQMRDQRSRGEDNTNNSKTRRLSVVVQNVLFDNATPADCVRQLLARDADVVVIVESTSSFIAMFDEIASALQQTYRYRISNDLSVLNEYAVTVLSRRELHNARIERLGDRHTDVTSGDFTVACAEIRLDDNNDENWKSTSLMLVATNLHACVDAPYVGRWRKQIQLLSNFLSSVVESDTDLLLVGTFAWYMFRHVLFVHTQTSQVI